MGQEATMLHKRLVLLISQKEELPKVELCPISIGKSGSPFSEQLLLLSEDSGYRGTALKDNSHGTLLLETT